MDHNIVYQKLENIDDVIFRVLAFDLQWYDFFRDHTLDIYICGYCFAPSPVGTPGV